MLQDASMHQGFYVSSDSPMPVLSVPTPVSDVPNGPTPGSNNLKGHTPAPDYPLSLPGYKQRHNIDTTPNQGPLKKQKAG